MGKANRGRRRMKEKARRQASAARSSAATSAPCTCHLGPGDWEIPGLRPSAAPSARDQVQHLIDTSIHVLDTPGVPIASFVSRLAAERDPRWRLTVERALTDRLLTSIGNLWRRGWQPADLVRIVQRRLKAPHLVLLRAGMAAELAGYTAATVDPRWAGQLEEGQVTVWWPPDVLPVQACGREHPTGWEDFVHQALILLHELAYLPPLELLGPVPGTAVRQAARVGQVDERVLTRVRALLAKAESTDFPAEAETFTAGAQALMARHSIDHALLAAAGRAPSDRPTGRRIGIDNPYESPKAVLLDSVASANRCRSVWSKDLGFATVVGFPTDLDHVEVLFTSLLVQATASAARDGSRTDRYGRSRTRAYRQSFLLSYATRIRERLNEATDQQTSAAAAESGGRNLLPVLASRNQAVEDAAAEMFPGMYFRSAGGAWDQEGWASGRAAADLVNLTPAEQLTG